VGRSGEWTFPSTVVAGWDLQALALRRSCAVGSPATPVPGRFLSLTSPPALPLLRPVVLAPARDSSPPDASRPSPRVALGDFVRRPFVEQAELGTEFFSSPACWPVGLAFGGVCWAGEQQPRTAGHWGCAVRLGRSQRSILLSVLRRAVRPLSQRCLLSAGCARFRSDVHLG
jgi:hypothetical protein